MKKIFKLSANLAEVHSRRYRKQHHLKDNFLLRVTWVGRMEKDTLRQRQPYVFMQRHPDGISRSVFIFAKPLLKRAKTDEDEFNKRVAGHEINRLKVKRAKEYFNEAEEK